MIFASQAALVIANARTHREERRARADLESLIDTSPVGVVVFDALTGAPKSLNREARRIADRLRDSGQSPEVLLDLMTCRRTDDGGPPAGIPHGRTAERGETLRAEEIVLGVPDGRTVTVLLNATPILSDEGAVESVVVTMQDMADVKELERLRADFLAMVSHELRAPPDIHQGIRRHGTGLGPGPQSAVVRQFFRIIGDQADHMHRLVSDLLDVARIETGTLAVSPEPGGGVGAGGPGPEAPSPAPGGRNNSSWTRPGPAPGAGGPGAHRPGAGQPVLQCGPATPRGRR